MQIGSLIGIFKGILTEIKIFHVNGKVVKWAKIWVCHIEYIWAPKPVYRSQNHPGYIPDQQPNHIQTTFHAEFL